VNTGQAVSPCADEADHFRLNRFKYFIALGTKLDVVMASRNRDTM